MNGRLMRGLAAGIGLVLLFGCTTIPKWCSLIVVDGSGSGIYAPLEYAVIVASNPPPGKVFDSWHGDISDIDNAAASSTRIRMLQRKKTVYATYSAGTPPTPPTPTNPPPAPVVYVPGNKAVDGESASSAPGIPGMDVRCLANDNSKIQCSGSGWYFVKGKMVVQQGGFKWHGNPDGSVEISATDFVSPASGLKYKFIGWTISKSANPLVTQNPHTIQKSDQNGTCRGYWATVK